MKKKEPNAKWEAEGSAPMPTKGRKGEDFVNQTTQSTENRFPWTTIIIIILLLCVAGFVLFLVSGLS